MYGNRTLLKALISIEKSGPLGMSKLLALSLEPALEVMAKLYQVEVQGDEKLVDRIKAEW